MEIVHSPIVQLTLTYWHSYSHSYCSKRFGPSTCLPSECTDGVALSQCKTASCAICLCQLCTKSNNCTFHIFISYIYIICNYAFCSVIIIYNYNYKKQNSNHPLWDSHSCTPAVEGNWPSTPLGSLKATLHKSVHRVCTQSIQLTNMR